MTAKQFHQQTIRGLIQTTVNRTLEDLVIRQLIDTTNGEVPTVDWQNLRSLNRDIDTLFIQHYNTRRERITIRNLITEIEIRAPFIQQVTALDTTGFETSLASGIKAYSQYIRRHRIQQPENVQGFQQTLKEQFTWGILHSYQRHLTISPRTSRYLEYRHDLLTLINRFFRDNGANLMYSNTFDSAQQNYCWCLFNYRPLPLYRTVLREFLRELYLEADRDLQTQSLDIPLTRLITAVENYTNQQCTHLHFNLRDNAQTLIAARYRLRKLREQTRQQMALDQNRL
jgi:hypothetical protein